MRITAASITPFRLELARPLRTAHGPIDAREGLLLSLTDASGLRGFGEATPIAGFGLESASRCRGALESLVSGLVGREIGELDATLEAARVAQPHAPVARAALDSALHDLVSRARGVSLAELLKAPLTAGLPEGVAVNALVAGDAPEEVAASGTSAVAAGFRTLKLKVGAGSLPSDEARIAALRQAAGPEVRIRLDANGAWSEADAGRALERFAPYEIELLEQPVAASELAALARLRARGSVPIAADEAAAGEADAQAVLEHRAADFVVIKPSAAGGLAAATRIATAAREAGIGVVVTSLLDGAVAVAAALHFAAALAAGDAQPRACGLATGGLFRRDIARLPQIRQGRIALPPGPGLGVTPDPAALVELAHGEPWEIAA